MNRIVISVCLVLLALATADAQIIKGSGVIYFDSIPNTSPTLPSGAEIAFGVKTGKLYRWSRTGSAWQELIGGAKIDSLKQSNDTLYIYESGVTYFTTLAASGGLSESQVRAIAGDSATVAKNAAEAYALDLHLAQQQAIIDTAGAIRADFPAGGWDFTAGTGASTVTVYQQAHGFTLPTKGYIPVVLTAGSWVQASTSDSVNLHQAFVVGTPDTDSITLQTTGLLTVEGHGLTVGEEYFLQDNGSESTSADATYNDWTVTVIDANTIDLKTVRPFGAISGGGGSGTPDQTLSFSNPNLTISGDGGNTVDISGVNYWTKTSTNLSYTAGNVGVGLSPTARLSVQGAANTSATTAFNVTNSASTSLLSIRDNGATVIGPTTPAAGYTFTLRAGSGIGNIMQLQNSTGTTVFQIDQNGLFFAGGPNLTNGSNFNNFRLSRTFAPTTGSFTFAGIAVEATINQTGGANGITRGVLVAPTLTAAADFRAFDAFNTSGYGFYQGNGVSVLNYFNGRTGFGGVTSPTARVQIRGVDTLTTSLNFLLQNSGPTDLFWVTNLGEIYFGKYKNTSFSTGTSVASLQITSDGKLITGSPSNLQRAFIESSTATTIDLDANTGVVKDVNGNNVAFVPPTNLEALEVFKNGLLLSRTGSVTTRDYSINTSTNEITFQVALISSDRIVLRKL